MNCPRLLEFQESLANGQRTPALSDLLRRKWNVLRQFKPSSLATCQGRRQQLEVVSFGAVPEARIGGIATVPSAKRICQTLRGREWQHPRRGGIRCKREWPAPCLNQRERGLSKQPQARRRE